MAAKILIVDDEPDVVRGWAKALKLAKHQVSFVEDALAALEISQTAPFDLVILDYIMPTMSGIELLNEIRKHHPFIRSIIISGKLDSSISEERMLLEIRTDIEADLYLHKPVDNSRLKEAVVDLLRKPEENSWEAIADMKLEAPTTKKNVRSAEKTLNKKKRNKK